MEAERRGPARRASWRSGRPSTGAWAGGTLLALSVRELELLAALARREGRIVPREELYETVWGGAAARRTTARSTSTSTSCA